MDFSKLSIEYHQYGANMAVVTYGSWYLIEINHEGIRRYDGITHKFSFIGGNGAIKVLRSYEGYDIAQNYTWCKKSLDIASKAHGGKIVPVGPISFFLHVKGDVAYLMVMKQDSSGNRIVNTVAAISDAGLAVADMLGKGFGIARDEARCRVWRVK